MLKNFLHLCPKATYLMKIDDDMFVNPTVINKVVRERRECLLPNNNNQRQLIQINENVIIGKKYDSYRPHRDPESKWYLPYWLYSAPMLPPYISGTGYLMSGMELNLFKASN